MKPNERLEAIHILVQLIRHNTSLTTLLHASKNSSAFTKELCYGFCRHYYRLETLADLLIQKRPKSLDVWVCILIGLYQLNYLNIAEYAVVKETVAVLPKIGADWAKGLVNAVLRRYCRDKETLLLEAEKKAAFLYGHPQWLLDWIKRSWPNHWPRICLSNDTRPPMSLRVNQRLSTVQSYLTRLAAAQIHAAPLSFSEQGIQLYTACDVKELPGFEEGLFSVQDEAAQLAVTLLDLAPNLRVLDACCAPAEKHAIY
jgi:16S rRNA (cytosine967-C5)-methyltransferase